MKKQLLACLLLSFMMPLVTYAGMDKYTTHCQEIEVGSWKNQTKVGLSLEREFEAGDSFELSQRPLNENGSPLKDLTALVLDKYYMDEDTTTRWGMGGSFRTHTKVFGAKLKLTSSDPVGTEIQGCIPREIFEKVIYTVCFESSTERIRPSEF